LNFLDYAWSSSFTITQKDPKEIRILLPDRLTYPILSTDTDGYVLYIAKPVKEDQSLLSLHGMFFDSDNRGKYAAWRLFKASVHHLSAHAVCSDFRCYSDWANDKDEDWATFVVSVVEDAVLKAYFRAYWPGYLNDAAYANYVSFLRMKSPREIYRRSLGISAAILSHLAVGRAKDGLDSELRDILEKTTSELDHLYSSVFAACSSKDGGLQGLLPPQSSFELRLKTAERLYSLLEATGTLPEVPSIPFTDNHGKCSLFESSVSASESERLGSLQSAYTILGLNVEPRGLQAVASDSEQDSESSTVFAAWESQEVWRSRRLEHFLKFKDDLHFSSFSFPIEDYGQFVRVRSKLAGPIRRILDELRKRKTSTDEISGHESGQIDLQAAIQVVASKSVRSDVFVREEILLKNEAWAVLVDTSKSLSAFAGEVKGVATCLAEVAKDLVAGPNSWALYGFSDKFIVVKDFSEQLTNSVRARIGGLQQGGTSYIPDALRLAAKELATTSEDLKVLVLVSDGFPHGYRDIDEALLKTAKELANSEIILLGIGLGSRAIKRFVRANCVVDSPYELMKYFAKAYLEFSPNA